MYFISSGFVLHHFVFESVFHFIRICAAVVFESVFYQDLLHFVFESVFYAAVQYLFVCARSICRQGRAGTGVMVAVIHALHPATTLHCSSQMIYTIPHCIQYQTTIQYQTSTLHKTPHTIPHYHTESQSNDLHCTQYYSAMACGISLKQLNLIKWFKRFHNRHPSTSDCNLR